VRVGVALAVLGVWVGASSVGSEATCVAGGCTVAGGLVGICPASRGVAVGCVTTNWSPGVAVGKLIGSGTISTGAVGTTPTSAGVGVPPAAATVAVARSAA
jgi:hypothetical protein